MVSGTWVWCVLRRRRMVLPLTLAALWAAGPAMAAPADERAVTPGMAEAEVIRILGLPKGTFGYETTRRLLYDHGAAVFIDGKLARFEIRPSRETQASSPETPPEAPDMGSAPPADSPREEKELARIPGDLSVTVGSPRNERGAGEGVDTGSLCAFHLGRHEVTKALWDEVYAWATQHGYLFDNPGSGKGPRHPVHSVNWYDSVKWCNARSEKEGLGPCYTVDGETYRNGKHDDVACDWAARGYRLPTEAEWEKGARGGLRGQPFPWGGTITHGDANYRSGAGEPYDASATSGFHPDYASADYPCTSPVCSFPPNGYGLYDVAGNVYEWCWDWFGNGSAPVPAVEELPELVPGPCRVVRGGCWFYSACCCRVTNRGCCTPGYEIHFLGFRLAQTGP
ncbi:MAG: SUMF1/EgtB/PvdO family nonheme iron enzyme [Lentisphaeria bacterium]|nr:SUMF1/EgtB/PvdO family nonheme iron enzyme [Lentisphaeria bacterium]